jgi:hypothetical protein
MTIEMKKMQISDLVIKCIGSRSLRKTSEDTGISLNKLSRIINRNYSRIPSYDFFCQLTGPDSNVQNNVSIDDFVNLLNIQDVEFSNNQNNQFNNALFSTILECVAFAIICEHEMSHGNSIVVNRISNHSTGNILPYDFYIKVDGKIKYYDFRLYGRRNTNPSVDLIILELARCRLGKDEEMVIVTNCNNLYNELDSSNLCFAQSVCVYLIDTNYHKVMHEKNVSK